MSTPTKNGRANVLDAMERMNKTLHCRICKLLVVDPHYVQCNHFFCKSCILSKLKDPNPVCPVCNIAILEDQIRKHRHIASLLRHFKQLQDLVAEYYESANEQAKVRDEPIDNDSGAEPAVKQLAEEAAVVSTSTPSTPLLNRSVSTEWSPRDPINKKNLKGETPLHVAAIKGHLDEVIQLLSQGAQVNVKDNAGWTPLHEAAHHGFEKIVGELLANGANVNIPASNNLTPLQDAVSNNRLEAVKVLMSYGADPLMRNLAGYTAFDMAKTDELFEILTARTRQNMDLVQVNLSPQTNLVFLGTGLSVGQQNLLKKCAELLKATIVTSFTDKVTHLVVPSQNCRRTFKYLMSVLSGKWILSSKWIEQCLKKGEKVDEAKYEVNGTTQNPKSFGPKMGREAAKFQNPGLFSGCHVYLFGEFTFPSLPKESLASLVKTGGGILLAREPKLDANFVSETVPFHVSADHALSHCSHYIIYCATAPAKPGIIYNSKNMKTLPDIWLVESISTFKLIEPNVYQQ